MEANTKPYMIFIRNRIEERKERGEEWSFIELQGVIESLTSAPNDNLELGTFFISEKVLHDQNY